MTRKIKDFATGNCRSGKSLGVTIDNDFSFPNHNLNLCSKTSQKIHALSRAVNYMTLDRKKILENIPYLSVRSLSLNVNLPKQRSKMQDLLRTWNSLRIVCKRKNIDFRTLPENASVTLRVQNLHYPEICNVKNDISTDIIKGVFILQENNS